MHYKYTLLFLILFLKSFAQRPVLQHYGVEDGLAGSCVYRALQDSKGFMWLLTDKGLSRFDGSRFQNFNMADGMPQNDVFLAGEDRHQRLWLYAYNDIFCYYDLNNNHFYTIPNPINVPKSGFIDRFFDTDTGMLVYANNSNIYKIDKKQHVSLLRNGGNVRGIDLQKGLTIQRQYPMIMGEPIAYYKNKPSDTLAYLLYGQDMPSKIIIYQRKLYSHPNQIALADSVLFLINGDWLDCYYKNKYIRKPLTEVARRYTATQIGNRIYVVGSNTRFAFVTTPNDCFIVDEHLNRQTAYDFINQLDVNIVNADKDGNLWICTKENGVYILQKEVPKITRAAQPIHTSIRSIVKDAKGNLIMGNKSGEIYVLYKDKMRKINFDAPINVPIKNLKLLPNGRLCVAWKDYGFTILSQQQLYADQTIQTRVFSQYMDNWANVSTKGKLPIINCYGFINVAIGPNNSIVLVSQRQTRLIKDSVHYWVSKVLEPSHRTKAALTDRQGNIWIGKSSGLCCLKIPPSVNSTSVWTLDSLPALKRQYPILNQPLIKLAHDRQSRLWIATGVGLNMLKTDKPTDLMTLQSIPELATDIVGQIYIGSNDKLWIATNKGIATLDISADDPLQYKFQRLNISPWLPSLEINDLLADSLNLYVATPKGLTVIALKDVFKPKKTDRQMPLVITSVKINKQDTTLQNNYQLAYFQNTIDISFVAINYQSIKDIRYQYRLLTPLSKDTFWHDVSDFHKEFAYLEPETYQFYVRATNITDNSSATQHLVFRIELPFWRKAWFLVSMVLLMSVGTFIVYKGRIKIIKTQEAAKTAVNKRFAELELKALQAQMNPHFIFNALTAIQSFILRNDTQTANTYLTQFSKLMRQSLESSRRKFIPLQDEITMLNNYISLEQARFKDKFDFNCVVGANVDLGAEIPSMLLQPFIENAINHGILYKKGHGQLTLTFRKDGETLQCIIEDDGVGRKEAAKMQAQSLKPHISRATQIMDERVLILQQVEDVCVSILIVDKTDSQNNSLGTKVILSIT